MSNIEEIASKHLGRAADGSVVQPYKTPDKIEPAPRSINRQAYGIYADTLPFFVGSDVWNCYEFSTLLENGLPMTGLLKVIYPADSKYIVESKSLKLYLNSFNMVRINGKNRLCVASIIEDMIHDHLTSVLETDVKVKLFHNDSYTASPLFGIFDWDKLENSPWADELICDKFEESPELLQTVSMPTEQRSFWRSSLLRSNCRVTNQPDWGDVFVYFQSDKFLAPSDFLAYIVSMRSENHFHEEICECIYKRLYDALSPSELFVACLYTRRGGIDINPIRASNQSLLSFAESINNVNVLSKKTLRQ